MRLLMPFLLAAVLSADVPPEVLDPHGALIPHATIEALGDSTVSVSAPGFETKIVRLTPGAPLKITLEPAVLHTSMSVVVRDADGSTDVDGSAVQIERTGARTILDAVERLVPSAFVTRRGVMGYGIATNGTGQVSIRGVGGSPTTGVLIVVDGRPDMQGLMGHPVPDFYSLSDAGGITVTQGPASVLYGSNAMGGAIEIRPVRPEPGYQTRLTASLGSYLTGQERLSHGGRFEKAFYNLTAGLSQTSGDRPSSKFRAQDLSTAVGYDLTPAWKASLQSRYGYFHVEDPGPEYAPLNNNYANVGRGGYDLNLDNAYAHSYGYTRVYGAYGRHYITDGFRSTDSTSGARAMQTFVVRPSLTLDLGGEFNRYGGIARNAATGLEYGEHTLAEGAGFTRAQWAPAGRWRATGGLRYHRHSLYGGLVVPEASLTFRLTPRYALSAAVARGFRNPTIRELYLFPAPNPGLRPESMWNWQGTFHANPIRSLSGWATFYYASLSNQIVTLGRYPNLVLANGGAALNRGLDLNVRWRPARVIEFTAGHAWLRSTNLSPLIPQNKLNASVLLRIRRAIVTVGAMSADRRWVDARHSRALGGYTLASAQLSIPLTPTLTLFTMADNLLNKRYEVLPGYPMPGPNASGGFTWTF